VADFQDEQQGNGWREYQQLVLAELKRLNGWLNKVDDRLLAFDRRLSLQEIKAGMWTVIGGMATIIVMIILKLLFTGGLR